MLNTIKTSFHYIRAEKINITHYEPTSCKTALQLGDELYLWVGGEYQKQVVTEFVKTDEGKIYYISNDGLAHSATVHKHTIIKRGGLFIYALNGRKLSGLSC